MQRSAAQAGSIRVDDEQSVDPAVGGPVGDEADTVVVHVQLRPRRGSTRRCLAALGALAAAHPAVPLTVTGLSKDDRVVRVTVGVDLGPRAGVARFSPQAQAAYALVSDVFTTLYDHMPVYAAEPTGAERAAALELMACLHSDGEPTAVAGLPAAGERVPA
ncbi:hypothetical protein [Blastococcus sp. SYSU D00820]